MAAAKKKQDDKNLTILRELITQNGNKNCFDCAQRGPTYVNMTIGSFICSKCSGMLRGLTPPHRVKSISMASFTPEEIQQIKKQGNDYCKSIWLALYEGNLHVLKDETKIKSFMYLKYEKRQYYQEPDISRKSAEVKDKPTVPNISPKDNGIWNSSSTKLSPPPKTVPTPQPQTTYNISKPPMPSSNSASLSFDAPVSCPRFPVDFASADIFNSSQMNNNPIAPAPPSQVTFANFDMKNSNTVTHDRYAALADLDFALRQQGQTNDNTNTTPVNPFDMNSVSEISKNPFYSNALAVNGNTLGYSNPFAMGSGVAPTGPSKNPFL